MATIESTVIHFQLEENSWQVLDRTSLVALKTLLIKAPKIHFKAVNTHSGEESLFIADVIFDEAVATTSVTVTRQRSKRETVTTTDVYTHQNTSSHSSGGTAHIITKALVQEGTKNVNVSISGPTPDVLPYVEQRDVHDTRHVTVDVQTHKRGGFFGGLFGGGVKKSYHSSSSSAISRGSENAGRFFKAMADRYKATNPSFTAVRSDITAPSVEISAGVNHHQTVEQSSSSGAIWNKSSITVEKHKVHVNPNFGGAVHIHSPDLVVERVSGSGLLPGLYSESPVKYRDMVDTHEHHHQSQKSLTAGAQLLIKLAMSIAMGNPCGAGLMGMVMSAGVTTLCSDAAVCLVENDGDPGRAMEAIGERNIGKSMLMSMAGAGLTGALGGSAVSTTGLSTSELITAYAKQELIKASVNATLAATIDGQDLGQAMLQGVVMAGINTAAAFGAHKIGDLQKPASDASTRATATATAEPIGYTTHKLLHTALGTGLGASMAAVTDQDVGKGAASGGFGALVGSIMTDAMVDDKDTPVTAQRMAQMSDLLTATLALGVGLDPVSAYLAAHNASENNFSRHRMNPIDSLVKAVEEGMTPKDGEEATPDQKEYKHGQDQFVMENLEQATVQKGGDLSEQEYVQVIESSRKQYAVEYTAQKSSEMLGHAMVGASELIPGMHGVNKAWMAVVNHARGELPKDALFDEVLGGVTSSLTDAAIMMATMGASHYYSSASRLVAKGGQVLGGLKKGSLGSAAFDKEALMQHPLMKGKIGPDRQLYAPEHIHNPHTPYSGGYQKSFVTTQEEIYYRVYSGKSTVGRFLTKTPPTSSAYAREALALPVENTAEFIQQVIVPKGTLLQRSRALPHLKKEEEQSSSNLYTKIFLHLTFQWGKNSNDQNII